MRVQLDVMPARADLWRWSIRHRLAPACDGGRSATNSARRWSICRRLTGVSRWQSGHGLWTRIDSGHCTSVRRSNQRPT